MQVSLKRLLKKKDISALLGDVLAPAPRVSITDADGRLLFGVDPAGTPATFPINLKGKTIGLVRGEAEQARLTASIISHLAAQEVEKKELGKETLDKYKEINLLYEITEKLTALLNKEDVARVVISEIQKIIRADYIGFLILEEESGLLKPVATWGKDIWQGKIELVGKGITGEVVLSGKGEIVNDCKSDPRCLEEKSPVSSLICAPLVIKDKCSGVVAVGTGEPHNYSAGDLKLLSALAFQGASTLENIHLFDNFLKEQEEKLQVTRIFGRYVASQVVDEILNLGEQNLKLGGLSREITVLFVDIRQFTTFVEQLSPEETVELLNQFFEIVTQCIFDNKGTIDKFIGDAVMAFFNAPLLLDNHAYWAVKAAQQIMQEISSLQEQAWERWKINLQPGIGINIGEAVVGNIGTESRMDYTAIGDTVNLAQRLESMATPGQVLFSEAVYQQVKDSFPMEPLAEKTVKGKSKPVNIYCLRR